MNLMTLAISYKKIRHEARLLYTLLDAMESDGRMTGTPFRSAWRELKTHVNSGATYEAEAEKFYELLTEKSGGRRHSVLSRFNPCPLFSAPPIFPLRRFPRQWTSWDIGGERVERGSALPEFWPTFCGPSDIARLTGRS